MVHDKHILLTEYGTVSPGSYQWMVMADPAYYLNSNPQDIYATFAIIPQDINDHNKGYKLRKKRIGRLDTYLMTNRTNPLFWTKIIYSQTSKKAKYDADRCVWKFDG